MKKRFFIAAAATVMTLAATSMASAAVITESTDESTEITASGWWVDGGFSDYYKLSGNFDVTFELAIKGGSAQWNSACCVITTDADRGADGYSEYAVFRADAYGWGNAALGFYSNVSDWKAFTTAMADGTATYNVKRVENNITVTMNFVGSGDKEYTVISNATDYFADDLRIFLAGDRCTFTVKSFTVNEAPEAEDYSYKLVAGGYRSAISPLYTYTGDFTKTFRVENEGGAELWNNPILTVLNSANTEMAAIRSDSFAFGNENVTFTGTTDLATITDSVIDITVSRSGNVITFVEDVQGANGSSYTYTATYTNEELTDAITFYLGADGSTMTVYEETQTQSEEPKIYAQYKKVSDNNYTVRLIAEVEYDAAVNTTFKRIGFRCAKSATGVGDSYLGVNVYKSIKANGQTVTAADGKYFVVLEITGVESGATLYVEPKYENTSNEEVSLGSEVEVKMSDIVQE